MSCHCNSSYISTFKKSHCHRARCPLWVDEIYHKKKMSCLDLDIHKSKEIIVTTQASKVWCLDVIFAIFVHC
jgi:hypothetical protein